jgi:hypothetical protein
MVEEGALVDVGERPSHPEFGRDADSNAVLK